VFESPVGYCDNAAYAGVISHVALRLFGAAVVVIWTRTKVLWGRI
jgi:hypothetical protein